MKALRLYADSGNKLFIILCWTTTTFCIDRLFKTKFLNWIFHVEYHLVLKFNSCQCKQKQNSVSIGTFLLLPVIAWGYPGPVNVSSTPETKRQFQVKSLDISDTFYLTFVSKSPLLRVNPLNSFVVSETYLFCIAGILFYCLPLDEDF